MERKKSVGSRKRSDRVRNRPETAKDAGSDSDPPVFGVVSIVAASFLSFATVVAYGAFSEGLLTGNTSPAREVADSGTEQPMQSVDPTRSVPSLSDSVRLLSARLAADPGDLEGWVLLGHSYLVMGRYKEALKSFSEARRLDPKNPDIQVSFGEALVLAAGDRVTPGAEAAFKAALDTNPGHPVARYFLALSAYQKGDQEQAVEMWRMLLAESPNDAPWREAVRQRLAAAGVHSEPDAASVAVQSSSERGPSAAFLEAAPDIANAPPGEQAAIIQSMVEGLAARLEDNPSDLNGWRMLARSYSVLGRPEEAKERLQSAIDSEDRGTSLRADLERLAVEIYGEDALN